MYQIVLNKRPHYSFNVDEYGNIVGEDGEFVVGYRTGNGKIREWNTFTDKNEVEGKILVMGSTGVESDYDLYKPVDRVINQE